MKIGLRPGRLCAQTNIAVNGFSQGNRSRFQDIGVPGKCRSKGSNSLCARIQHTASHSSFSDAVCVDDKQSTKSLVKTIQVVDHDAAVALLDSSGQMNFVDGRDDRVAVGEARATWQRS
jgi:hypothetical protein